MTTVPEMRDPAIRARRLAATGAFHARMAAAFRSVGRIADAEAAEAAAAKCKQAEGGPHHGRP